MRTGSAQKGERNLVRAINGLDVAAIEIAK
jgi:hypothetical protein